MLHRTLGMAPPASTLDPSVVARWDQAVPRYTSYPTIPDWKTEFGAEDRLRALSQGKPAQGFGVYIHVPFCRSRCRFCGCNVVVARNQSKGDVFVEAALDELRHWLRAVPGARPRLDALHLGGGTPTFLTPDQLQTLIDGVTSYFRVEDDVEMGFEAEPTVTTDEQLVRLFELGFRRVSFGVQDVDQRVLQIVGRPEHAENLPARMETARSLNYESINLDLIYGLPGQSAPSWERSIDRVIDLQPDRIALFSFAFLPDRLRHQRPLGKHPRLEGAGKVDLFLRARTLLMEAGYVAIGMDHFARPEDGLSQALDEGRLGRNFQGYTDRASTELIGIGPSAISDVGGAYFQNPTRLAEYYVGVEQGDLPPARGLWRTKDDDDRRSIIMELMCTGRLRIGPSEGRLLAPELERLRSSEFEELVDFTEDGFQLREAGLLFVRNVAMVFDAYRSAGENRFSRSV
ncbi:MAG: oxygen-independent coproporphyrinogen III oxidase [Myxococcota bacterium]